MTISAAAKQTIYIHVVIWDTIQRHTSLPLYCSKYIYHMPKSLPSFNKMQMTSSCRKDPIGEADYQTAVL